MSSCAGRIAAAWLGSAHLHGNGLLQVVALHDLLLLVMVDDVADTVGTFANK